MIVNVSEVALLTLSNVGMTKSEEPLSLKTCISKTMLLLLVTEMQDGTGEAEIGGLVCLEEAS